MGKRALNLLVEADLVERARQNGIVISKFLENKLQEHFQFMDAIGYAKRIDSSPYTATGELTNSLGKSNNLYPVNLTPSWACGVAWYPCGFGSHRHAFKSHQAHHCILLKGYETRGEKKDMTTRSDRAVAYFKEGFSCSQAVLASFAVENGLSVEQALKVAGAFGGGMGRMGDTCGAVTGAFLVIGLKYGKTRIDDEPSKEKTYRLVQEFAKRFRSRHGSIVCRDLLGCDLSTPEGRKTATENHRTETRCPLFVQDAVEILEKKLHEKKK